MHDYTESRRRPPSAGPQLGWGLPHTLTILATYKCTAACEHCCFQSNPRITHRVPQDRLLRYVDEAAALGSIRLVCFSGGEPFVLGSDLVELVERSTRHGLMTRIVSNGSWAVSEKLVDRKLSALVEAGLNEINFSTGDDHRAFVPVGNVLRGLAGAIRYGLTAALMIEDRIGRSVSRDTVLAEAAAYPEVLAAFSTGRISMLESPWMPFAPDGEPIHQEAHKLVNASNVHMREPCKSVLTTIVVTPSEQLGVCCGLPREQIKELHAGNLREHSIRELTEAALTDFLNIWLFVEGPEKMLAWAASKDPTIEWENRYSHNCDACRAFFLNPRVMRVFRAHYEEKYADVLMRYALFQEGAPPPPLEVTGTLVGA